jgi:hypothetical protein
LGAVDDEELEASPRADHGHEVFDRLNRDLSLATTFDLGEQELQARFNTYDSMLNPGASSPAAAPSGPLGLQMSDLEADLAALRTGTPQAPAQAHPEPPAAPAPPDTPKPSEAPQAESSPPPAATTPATPAGEATKQTQAPIEPPPAPAAEEAPTTDTGVGESPASPEPTVRVQHTVPSVQAQEGLSPWAACAAMLVAWRDKVEIDPKELVARKGHWEKYKDAIGRVGSTALDSWKLKQGGPTVLDVESIQQLMAAHGPLLIARSETDAKPRVLTAVVGDGSGAGTKLRFKDPNTASDNNGSPQETFDTFHEWQSEGDKPGVYYAQV